MASENSIPSFDDLKKTVEDICVFRDNYFHDHKGSTESKKEEEVETKVSAALEMIEKFQDDDDKELEKKKMQLRITAWEASSKYSLKCEEMLTRYLKFHQDHETFIVLGLNYWKKKDYFGARNCFECSLDICKNVEAFQNLSMLIRISAQNITNECIQKSIEYADNAIMLDVTNGKSWYVKGAAHFQLYFKCLPDQKNLITALKCYKNAARCPRMLKDPYFLYAFGLASMYSEHYDDALKWLDMSCEYVSSFEDPKKYSESLKAFLNLTQQSISNKGKSNARRLAQLTKKYNLRELGPFQRNVVFKKNGKEKGPLQLKLIKISDLKDGANDMKVLLGVVVCHVFAAEPLSFTFCIIDDNGSCFAVNVYNFAEHKGVKIGDVVAIPEPYVKEISCCYGEEKIKFKWIRVDWPTELIINGRSVPESWEAAPVLSSNFIAE